MVCALQRPSVFAPHCSPTSSDGITATGLPEGQDFCLSFVAFAFSLMLAFSQSMWSQAVIAEVYALHALLIAAFLTLCYSWVLRPESDALMLGAFFSLALSFSNHHLTIALAPLPFLLILLIRRRTILDWLFAGLLTLSSRILGFCHSVERCRGPQNRRPVFLLRRSGIRAVYLAAKVSGPLETDRLSSDRHRRRASPLRLHAAGLGNESSHELGIHAERRRILLLDKPLSISGKPFRCHREVTRPPHGNLPTQGGNWKNSRALPGQGRLERAQLWIGFFLQQLIKAFSIVGLVGYFASFLFVFRFPLPKRVWIYFLHLAFVLAAFLQPLMSISKIDNAEWWAQMPFHTYTNLIFAILSGLGVGFLIFGLMKRSVHALWLAPALLVLAHLYLPGKRGLVQSARPLVWMDVRT